MTSQAFKNTSQEPKNTTEDPIEALTKLLSEEMKKKETIRALSMPKVSPEFLKKEQERIKEEKANLEARNEKTYLKCSLDAKACLEAAEALKPHIRNEVSTKVEKDQPFLITGYIVPDSNKPEETLKVAFKFERAAYILGSLEPYSKSPNLNFNEYNEDAELSRYIGKNYPRNPDKALLPTLENDIDYIVKTKTSGSETEEEIRKRFSIPDDTYLVSSNGTYDRFAISKPTIQYEKRRATLADGGHINVYDGSIKVGENVLEIKDFPIYRPIATPLIEKEKVEEKKE